MPNTDSRSGYCTSTRTFHIMRAPSFSPSSDVPFVFPSFALFFLPNLLPPHTVAVVSRPTLVDAGMGRVGHAPDLSVRAIEEDMVAPATLRLSWR